MKATLTQNTVTHSGLPNATDATDEALLLAYRDSGDRHVFSELVHRYERELYSYLRRYLGDAEMAEDAFQAAFLQVHLKCGQFEAGRSFRPWLYTIAINQAIDGQRRSRRHRMISLDRTGHGDSDEVGKLLDLLVSHEPSPTLQISQDERKAWLQDAVEQLPSGYRDALELVYFQDMKYREAADALDIPVGTVKSRVHAAILKLTEAWNQAHPEST
jgi:RNA polymerase sigma-70 factor (ECF subfamily)